MRFSKMQGAGNDFILLDGIRNTYEDYSKMAKSLCDRRYGIGGDGLMVAEKSDVADIKMVYYNSDGSKGEMCGNGIRCFSKFVYDEKLVNTVEIKIETGDGIKKAYLTIDNDIVKEVTIYMGKARLSPKEIPVDLNSEKVLNEKIKVRDKEFQYSAVLIGVPHAVLIEKDLEKVDVNLIGEEIEKHLTFPKRINVNFIEILDRNNIKIKTWERGAGRTLACGTGSCSGVYIANLLDLVDETVLVKTEGGTLKIRIESDEVFMTGSAETTFKGEIEWE
ncbi:MAG: diaminopimelate epimerase [Cetobacterium sp.]|uniref:diaminopimelate epimerase n=1 Tax=Cetobacterium sp. TaxID=2071632 RepID=UPI003F3B32F2